MTITMKSDSREILVVHQPKDLLGSIEKRVRSPVRYTELHLHLGRELTVGLLVEALQQCISPQGHDVDMTNGDEFCLLNTTRCVQLDCSTHFEVDWTFEECHTVIEILALFPNLSAFVCKNLGSSDYKFPLVHVTTILTLSSNLEQIYLENIHFLVSRERASERGFFDETIFTPTSRDMWRFHRRLTKHPKIKAFHAQRCFVSEANCEVFNCGPLETGRGEHRNQKILSLMDVWLNHLQWSFSNMISKFQCSFLDIPASYEYPHRIFLRLHRTGALANAAIKKALCQLQTDKSIERFSLWIDPKFRPDDSEQSEQKFMLKLCDIFSHNSTLKVLDVGGNEHFISPGVLVAFQDLLKSGRNCSMTTCDLMEQQGCQIDFYCRLNGLDRAKMLQRLHNMIRQEWLDDVLLTHQDDLSILYYWNRIHPIFLSQLG